MGIDDKLSSACARIDQALVNKSVWAIYRDLQQTLRSLADVMNQFADDTMRYDTMSVTDANDVCLGC